MCEGGWDTRMRSDFTITAMVLMAFKINIAFTESKSKTGRSAQNSQHFLRFSLETFL